VGACRDRTSAVPGRMNARSPAFPARGSHRALRRPADATRELGPAQDPLPL